MDSTFGIGGFKLGSPVGTDYHVFKAHAVALQSNGNIIVAGQDNWGTTGDTAHPLLMRFYGSTPSPFMVWTMADFLSRNLPSVRVVATGYITIGSVNWF